MMGGEFYRNRGDFEGGGAWIASASGTRDPLAITGAIIHMTGGSFRNNYTIYGDGGAIFANPTSVADSVPFNVYYLNIIERDGHPDEFNYVEFSGNTAGGGTSPLPDNDDDVLFGHLLNNDNINYRRNWLVTFALNGGHVPPANMGPVTQTFNDGEVIGSANVPVPVREGFIFLGWRWPDGEENDDDDSGGGPATTVYKILNHDEVAAHEVRASTTFIAQWGRGFEFFKTGTRLYENPPVIEVRGGAIFRLYRQVEVFDELLDQYEYSWEEVLTDPDDPTSFYDVTSDSNGRVVFILSPYEVYRIREIVAPTGYRLPPADSYWIIRNVDEAVHPSGLTIERSSSDYRIPPFLWLEDDEDYSWFVGNIRDLTFEFHKTDEMLYLSFPPAGGEPMTWSEMQNFLLAGAQFRLFRYHIPNSEMTLTPGLTDNYLVEHDPAHSSGNPYFPWVPVDLTQSISTGNQSTPIWYDIDPRFTYQLVETEAPSLPVPFITPWGQWRIGSELYQGEYQITVLRVGDPTMPDFIEIPELGYWFVGNRRYLPPLTGASPVSPLTVAGISVILLGLGIIGIIHARRARQVNHDYEIEIIRIE